MDFEAQEKWIKEFTKTNNRVPTNEEHANWLNAQKETRRLAAEENLKKAGIDVDKFKKKIQANAESIKVETAPLDDISMGSLNSEEKITASAGAKAAGAGPSPGASGAAKNHNKIKSNENFAKAFDFDFGFLSRDANAFGKAFKNAMGTPEIKAGSTFKAIKESKISKAPFAAAKNEKSFSKIGSTLLHDLGEGNKMIGAGKLGAYAVGAVALLDFLNPFDDD